MLMQKARVPGYVRNKKIEVAIYEDEFWKLREIAAQKRTNVNTMVRDLLVREGLLESNVG